MFMARAGRSALVKLNCLDLQVGKEMQAAAATVSLWHYSLG